MEGKSSSCSQMGHIGNSSSFLPLELIFIFVHFSDAHLHSKTLNHFTFSETVLAPRLSVSSLNIKILGGGCLKSSLPADFSLVEETWMWTSLEASGGCITWR